MNAMMYKNPRNKYERKINDINKRIDEYMEKGFFARLDDVATNLEIIYRKAHKEFQDEIAEGFYKILVLTEEEM